MTRREIIFFAVVFLVLVTLPFWLPWLDILVNGMPRVD
jgi:hypothetical protein